MTLVAKFNSKYEQNIQIVKKDLSEQLTIFCFILRYSNINVPT